MPAGPTHSWTRPEQALHTTSGCPKWPLEQVRNHLGRAFASVTTVSEGDLDNPPDGDDVPAWPGHQPPTGCGAPPNDRLTDQARLAGSRQLHTLAG
jgi:hypothetical protein